MIARKVIHAARIRESFLTALMTVATGLILPVANSAQGTSTVPRTTATAVTSSRDFSGVWVVKTGQRSALMFNAKQELPLTVWGKQQFSAPRHAEQNKPRDVPNLTDPHTFCDPVGMPRVDLSKRPIEIVQTDAEMFVFYEEDHSWRQIYMDGRALPESPDPSYLGYSVGKWEGDTLVVDTGGLNDKTWLDGVGHPHSDSLHVVERLRRNGPDTLSLTVTIEDPKAYTKAWTSVPRIFTAKRGYELTEDYCVAADSLGVRKAASPATSSDK